MWSSLLQHGRATKLILSILILSSSPVAALELEEVIVTARRAQESILEAPISVDVFTKQTIEDAGIGRPEDFLQLVPNVLFLDTAEAGDTQVIIRGVLNTRDVDQSYALVVDGVSQPNPNALNREMLDVEQIEVVKGPVSPIYGRNALGGAIIINTKTPSNEVEARVAASAGNGDYWKGSAMLSGPLVRDQLYGRISAVYTDFDGVFDNEFLGGTVDFHEETRVRGRLLWEPADTVTVDAVIEYADIDSSAIAFNLQVPGLQPQFANGIDVNDTDLVFSNNVKSVNPGTRWDLSMKADWESSVGTFTGIFGRNYNSNKLGSDFIVDFASPTLVPEPTDPFGNVGYTSNPGSIAYQERKEDDLTIEARYTSHSDQRLRWGLGGSYVEQNREVYVALDLDFGGGEIGRAHPGPQTVLINEWLLTETEVWSIFGNVEYDLTENLTFSFAARYDDEERVTTNLNSNFVPLFNIFPGLVQTFKFDKFQPRVSLSWQASDQLNFFASYGQGYRAGGFNAPGTRQLVLAVDGLPATSNIQDSYQPEEAESFEIGFKSVLMDSRLRFNAAAFHTTAENTQIFAFTPVTSTRARLNIDETKMVGFELDFYFLMTEDIDLFGSFGYTDADIEENAANPTIEGNPVLGVPKYTANLGAQYERPLRLTALPNVRWFSRLDWQRIGDTPWDIDDNPGTERDPVDLVNIRAGLRGENWSVVAWSRNLLDENYNAENIISTNAVLGVVNFAARGQTRTFGIDLEYNF